MQLSWPVYVLALDAGLMLTGCNELRAEDRLDKPDSAAAAGSIKLALPPAISHRPSPKRLWIADLEAARGR
jgi:hypothetical protein